MKRNCFRILMFVFVFSLLPKSASAQIWTYWSLPHMVIGDNTSTTLIIRETQKITTRQIYVWFFNNDGVALKANVTDAGQQISTFNFTLGALQEKSFVITLPSSPGTVTQGWIQIASEGPGLLSASCRFTVGPQATPTTVVGVLQTDNNFEWTIAVDKRTDADWTGVAVVNPWSGDTTFTVEFLQNGTRVPGTTVKEFPLKTMGHWAKLVSETDMFGSAWNSFTGVGTLRIRCASTTLAAMALRGDQMQYSSLPADAEMQRWSVTYTDTAKKDCTWQWKFVDGYTFVGWEQNPMNTDKVRLRGVWALTRFVAEWHYDVGGGVYGIISFIGTLSADGNTITGKRMDLDSEGTLYSAIPFTATRVY
jgi:hypothetical protein